MESLPHQLAFLFEEEKTKRCTVCTRMLPVSNFNKSKARVLCSRCKECNRRICREWSAANKERRAQYRIENAEKIKSYMDDWHERHLEHEVEYRRSYYAANRESQIRTSTAWRRANRHKVNAARRERYWRNPRAYLDVNKRTIAKKPALYREISRRSYWRNQEANKASSRKYYQSHKDRARIYSKEYAAAHRLHIRAYWTSWSEANREKYNEVRKAWLRRNHERCLISMRSAKAKRRSALAIAGKFTPDEWQDLCAKYDYTCLCCRNRLLLFELTVDHVMPLSRGGMNTIDNLQPLCGRCNRKKHVKHIDYRIGWVPAA